MQHPIILIHAFPLDSTMWASLADHLRAAGHIVITPELPGFASRPPWRVENYSIEALADDIYTLIERQAGNSAIVGGCSVGGYILLALLRRHPEVIRAAIFLDTHPAADSPETAANRMKTIADVQRNGVAPLAQAMPGRLLSPKAPDRVRAQVMEIIERQSPDGVMGLQYAMARRSDQTGLLPTLKIPTLFIVGEDDQITPPAVMRAMAKKCAASPACKLEVIPDAGHLAALEQPMTAAKTMMEFLS